MPLVLEQLNLDAPPAFLQVSEQVFHLVNGQLRPKLTHLQGCAEKRDHGLPALNTILYTDLAELWRAQQALDAWYITWGDTLSEANADEMVRFTLIGGKRGEMRRSEIILHVVNHTSYHRGFVADMFYQVPIRPPLTDLPVFLTTR